MQQHRMCEMFVSESWTVIDAAVPTTEPHAVSLAGLKAGKYDYWVERDLGGCVPLDGTVTELLILCISAEPVRDLPWLSQPKVDDDWSGLSKNNNGSYS